MSETMRMWVEVGFNIFYLVAIWGLVIAMTVQRDQVAPADRKVASLVRWAFFLLALGDTGHVGFRLWAYAAGGLDSAITLFGQTVGLVGLGALATAVTVTFFYVLMLGVWHERYQLAYGWFGAVLVGAAVVRLILMLPPQNEWNNVVPPQPWSLLRNLPLMVQGLGVAFLILRDARPRHDRPFVWIGAMILVSYACYIPVILFVQQAPMIGMLMIPKTMAYVSIVVIAYLALYRSPARLAVTI